MPEVVATYVAHKDLNRCSRILDDLVTSLKADFAKYKKHVPYLRIAESIRFRGTAVGRKVRLY